MSPEKSVGLDYYGDQTIRSKEFSDEFLTLILSITERTTKYILQMSLDIFLEFSKDSGTIQTGTIYRI